MLVSRHHALAVPRGGRPALAKRAVQRGLAAIRNGGAECMVPSPALARSDGDGKQPLLDVGILGRQQQCPAGACVADATSSLGGRCAAASFPRRLQWTPEQCEKSCPDPPVCGTQVYNVCCYTNCHDDLLDNAPAAQQFTPEECLEKCPDAVDFCNSLAGDSAASATTTTTTTTTGPTATTDLDSFLDGILDSLEDINAGFDCANDLLNDAASGIDTAWDALLKEQEEQFQGCIDRCPTAPSGGPSVCHCFYSVAPSADVYACVPDAIVTACQDGSVSGCLLPSETKDAAENFYCPIYLCANSGGPDPDPAACCQSARARCTYCLEEGAAEELYLCYFGGEEGLQMCEMAQSEGTYHYSAECLGIFEESTTATGATTAAAEATDAAAAIGVAAPAVGTTDGTAAGATEIPAVGSTDATEDPDLTAPPATAEPTGGALPSSAGAAAIGGAAAFLLVFGGLFNLW